MLGMIARPNRGTTNVAAPAMNGNFPASNTIINDYGRMGRTSSGAVGNYDFDYDLGSAYDIDAIAVLWSNLRPGVDTITIIGATSQANLSASPGYNSGALFAVTGTTYRDVVAPGKFLVTPGSVQTFRYWRVRISVVGTAHPAGYVQFSRALFMRKALFQIGYQRAELSAVDFNQKIQLDSGDDRSSEDSLLIRPIAQLDLQWEKQSEMEQIFGQYTLGLGLSLPLMVVPDLTAGNLQDQIVFGRPEQIISHASDTYDAWKFQCRVRSFGP